MGRNGSSLKNIADELASSDDEDDYDSEGYDEYDGDDAQDSKSLRKLSQSSPGRMRSRRSQKSDDATFSLSIDEAADVLRKSSDQSLFGRLFATSKIGTSKLGKSRGKKNKMSKEEQRREHRRKLDEMAKPREKKSSKLRFASEDDEKNCTFNAARKTRGEQKRGDESKENGTSDFTIRMEARERSRRQKLERKRGEKAYESIIDKKQCPNCGAVQSYDEVVSRRNKCKKSGCNLLYRKPGMKDNKVFLKRLEKMQKDGEKKKKILQEKHTPKFQPEHRIMFDPAEGKVVKVPYKNRSRDWDGFLSRMKDAENKRTIRMQQGGLNE